MEFNLEVTTEKTKYMGMSWDQSTGQNNNVKIGNKSFEREEQFKYLGTLTNINSMHEEIKRILKSESACCHSVQSISSSSCYPKI
jgi:hypothetical protein